MATKTPSVTTEQTASELHFEKKQITLTIEGVAATHEDCINQANALIRANKLDDAQQAINYLTVIEASDRKLREEAEFDKIIEQESPYEAAAKTFFVSCLSHTVETNKDDGRLISVNSKMKNVKISLSKLAKYGKDNINAEWLGYAHKFNQLLSVKHATELGADPDKIKKLTNEFYISETAKAIDMGKTPTSKTQLCKALQMVIDKMIWKSVEGKTENGYRVNNYDVAFIEDGFGKVNKKAKMTVTFSKNNELSDLLLDVICRLITNGKYDFDAKFKK